jgi:hypothetical protein
MHDQSMFSGPADVMRVKRMALDAYTKWKIEQLLPIVRQWAVDGADLAEIERRLGTMEGQVRGEAERTLRCVTIAALQDGADNG